MDVREITYEDRRVLLNALRREEIRLRESGEDWIGDAARVVWIIRDLEVAAVR